MKGTIHFLLGVTTTLLLFGYMIKNNYVFGIFDENFVKEYWESTTYEIIRIITTCMFSLTTTLTFTILFKNSLENENK